MRSKKNTRKSKVTETFTIDDIYSLTKTAQDMARIFGLCPLNPQNEVSVLALCYVTVVLSALTSCWTYSARNIRYNDISASWSVRVCVDAISILALFAIQSQQVLQRKKTRKILNKMEAVDDRLAKLGVEIKCPQGKRYSTMIIVIIFLSWYFCHCAFLVEIEAYSLVLRETLDSALVLFSYIISRNFVALMNSIEKHLDLIKNYLAKVISIYEKTAGALENTDILSVFNDICDLSESVEESHCQQIAILMAPVFLNITEGLFTEIFQFQVAIPKQGLPTRKNTYALISTFINTGLWFLVLLDVVTGCEECKRKVYEFNTAIYNLAMEDKTKGLITNQQLQLHMIMKREIKFTANGFFPLDNTLIHTIIGAATTYLIILIQFGEDK